MQDTITASRYAMVCFQEMKLDNRGVRFLYKPSSYHRNFDLMNIVDARDTFGGLLNCWGSSKMSGAFHHRGVFSLSTSYQFLHSSEKKEWP